MALIVGVAALIGRVRVLRRSVFSLAARVSISSTTMLAAWMVMLAAALTSLLAATASADTATTSTTPTEPASDAEMIAQDQQQEDEWETYIASPQAASARAASQTAYANETGSQAQATDTQQFPGEVDPPAFHSLDVSDGGRVLQMLGANAALVQSADGHASVAVSTLPLDGTTPSGASALLDLSLTDQNGSYTPASSLVPVTIPSASNGIVNFPNADFGVQFSTGSAATGTTLGDSMFYPNVGGAGSDTDAEVRPLALGADITFVLRSAASPETQMLTFKLPPAWTLAASSDGSGSVGVLDASGNKVATLLPPVATDAQGQTVPTSYQVEGTDQVQLTVAHQTGDYAYPIMVDPAIINNLYNASQLGADWEPINDSGYGELNDFDGYTGWKTGSYTQYQAGDVAAWKYVAPPNDYVYKLSANGVYNTPWGAGGGSYYTAEEAGILSTSGTWESPGQYALNDSSPVDGQAEATNERSASDDNYVFCARENCLYGASSGIDTGNSAAIRLHQLLAGNTGSSGGAGAGLTGATVYLSDNATPAVTISGYQSGSWIGPSSSVPLTVTGTVQYGLGMYSVGLTGLQTNPSPVTNGNCVPGNVAKTGSTTPPCAYTFSNASQPFTVSTSNLSQGANTLTGTAQDAGGNNGTSQPLTVYADDSTPAISFSDTPPNGQPSAVSNANDPDPGMAPGTTLTIAATDSSNAGVVSGINSSTFTVSVEDDTTGDFLPSADIQFQTPGCSPGAADSCDDTATLSTANLPAGNYTIASQASNVAGTSSGVQTLNFELAGTHTETWAYDDSTSDLACNGGNGASASLVQAWLSYAETYCAGGGHALTNCHSGSTVYCQVLQYIDPNLPWSLGSGSTAPGELFDPLMTAGQGGTAAPEQWYVHTSTPCNTNSRVQESGSDGTADLLYQGTGALASGGGDNPCWQELGSPYKTFPAWLDTYVNSNFSGWDGFMMDDMGLTYSSASATYEEFPTRQDAVNAHDNLANTMINTNTSEPQPYPQVDNAWPASPYSNPVQAPPEELYEDGAVEGMIMEGAPWTSYNAEAGDPYTITPDSNGDPAPWEYENVLDSMAWVDHNTPGTDFLALLSYDPGNFTSVMAPGNQLEGRLVQEATVLLGYQPGKIVSWADLENPNTSDNQEDPNTQDLAVWPEQGIYPTDPVQNMGSPAGTGCLGGNGPDCSSGGHNDVAAPTTEGDGEIGNGSYPSGGYVYRREFRECFDQGSPIGPCAAIVNDSGTQQTVQGSWLTQSYNEVITPEPGTSNNDGWDVESGGWINTCGQQDAPVPGQSFTVGSTTIAPWSAIMIDDWPASQPNTCGP